MWKGVKGVNNQVFLTEDAGMSGRILGLDAQLLVDTAILAVAFFTLFVLLSYLLFNPAREYLRKRQEYIRQQLEDAAADKETAAGFKAEYEEKMSHIDKEAEHILNEATKKAKKRESQMIEEAKQEASKIIERTNREISLEKAKVKDDMKREMISVASAMAGRFVASEMDEKKQEELFDDALKEMGDDTWQN